jgi:hypothetical protein
MPMPGTTPPFVIPALVAAGVALVAAFGPPGAEPRAAAAGAGHPVTLHLPAATYEALSRQGGGVPGVQERATRMLVEAAGR